MGLFNTNKTILVIEDEADIAENIQARLKLEKYNVVLAGNGEEGVKKARAKKPDLILLDIMMPKIDGYDVCRILKNDEGTKTIPIVVLTALPQVQDADRAFEAGADDFLNKPYSNERLMQKIHKFLPQKLSR